jgi:hypothetical protein
MSDQPNGRNSNDALAAIAAASSGRHPECFDADTAPRPPEKRRLRR